MILPLNSGQLIGSRGIFTLPDGEVYRYRVLHILPQIYTANHATFPIQMYAIRFVVISEARSRSAIINTYLVLQGRRDGGRQRERGEVRQVIPGRQSQVIPGSLGSQVIPGSLGLFWRFCGRLLYWHLCFEEILLKANYMVCVRALTSFRCGNVH